MSKSGITVAKYIDQQLALCGRSQRDVAVDCGYSNPNIISMFKNGVTKVPINKVSVLASAIGVDPSFLLRLLMTEYMPETWDEIQKILGQDKLMSAQEIKLAVHIRDLTANMPFDLSINDNRMVLERAVAEIVSRDQQRGLAAVTRIESLPKNSRNK